MAEGDQKKGEEFGPPTFGSKPVVQAFQAATEAQKNASGSENMNNSASSLRRGLTDGGKVPEKPRTTLTNAPPNAPPNPFKTLLLPAEAGFRENQNAYQSSEATPSGRDQYLEAYIACPQAQNAGDTVIWSYKVDILPLDEAAVRSHLRKLGSDYSVLYSIADLPPALLDVVQNRTKDREGQLVLVQDCKNTSITTGMGAFNAKSIIFVIRIGPNGLGVIQKAQVAEGEKGEKTCFKPAGFHSGNSTPIFRPNENNNNDLFPRSFPTQSSETIAGLRLFQDSVFKQVDFLSAFTQPNGNSYEDTAQEPSSRFQEMIKDLDFGRDALGRERNMTISTGNGYTRPDLSLEELRVADYAAGRTGPNWNGNGQYLGHNEKASYTLMAEKPLGSGPSNKSSPAFRAASTTPATGSSGSKPPQTQPDPRPSGPVPTLSSFCAPPKPKSPCTGQEQSANPFSGYPKGFLAAANSKTPAQSSSLTPTTTEQNDKCKRCSANLVSSSEADRAIGLCKQCKASDTSSCWLCEEKVPAAADAEPEATKVEESANNSSHAPLPRNILPMPSQKQHGAMPGTLFPTSRATFVVDTNGVVQAQGVLGPSRSSSSPFSPSRLPSFQFSSSSQASPFSFGTNAPAPPSGFPQGSAPNLEAPQIGSSRQGQQKTEDVDEENGEKEKQKEKEKKTW